MRRVLIPLAFAISLSVASIWATAGPAVGQPADGHPPFVEGASPQLPLLAMTIL